MAAAAAVAASSFAAAFVGASSSFDYPASCTTSGWYTVDIAAAAVAGNRLNSYFVVDVIADKLNSDYFEDPGEIAATVAVGEG